MGDFEDEEGATMAKFFNKEYTHAYKRGNVVWVHGKIPGQKYQRVSTGKKFSKANMNRAEKNWDAIILKYIEEKVEQDFRAKTPTLAEFIPISLTLNEDSADKHTLKSYKGILERHVVPELGDYKINEISAMDIKVWQKKLYLNKLLSQKTIINIRAVLSGVFRNAIESGISNVNPISITKPPSKKNFLQFNDKGEVTNLKGEVLTDSVDPFSLEDVYVLINKATGQFKNIIATLFFTGMRTGEMVTLRWNDIDWQTKTIHIQRSRKRDTSIGTTKNSKTRRIDMLPPVEEALKAQFKLTGMKNGFIFLNQYGERYHDYDILRDYHWRNLLKRAGYDYRPLYQTRHTFASIMLQKGEDIAWISERMLGHSEIATTLKYYSKYIQPKDKVHASFLYNSRTNHVQTA